MEMHQAVMMGKNPAPILWMKTHHGWLLIYMETMQLPMSKLRTGMIAVVSKLKWYRSILPLNVSTFLS